MEKKLSLGDRVYSRINKNRNEVFLVGTEIRDTADLWKKLIKVCNKTKMSNIVERTETKYRLKEFRRKLGDSFGHTLHDTFYDSTIG